MTESRDNFEGEFDTELNEQASDAAHGKLLDGEAFDEPDIDYEMLEGDFEASRGIGDSAARDEFFNEKTESIVSNLAPEHRAGEQKTKRGHELRMAIIPLLIFVGMLFLFIFVIFPTEKSDFEYKIIGDTVTVTGYSGELLDVVIPETIEDKPVTAIGGDAFRGSPILSVSIPGSVTEIGSYAFSGTKITSIELPYGLKTIGEKAFEDCNLNKLDIPDTVTSIGAQAFRSCDLLTSVRVGRGLKEISTGLFSNCMRLSTVSIPLGVERISQDAFFCCTGLRHVIIPSSCTAIGARAFYMCGNLGTVEYHGTEEEWALVSKDDSWDASCREYTIQFGR